MMQTMAAIPQINEIRHPTGALRSSSESKGLKGLEGLLFIIGLPFQFVLGSRDQWSVLERFWIDRIGKGLNRSGLERLPRLPVIVSATSQTHRKE
jgi:hypothetical protein